MNSSDKITLTLGQLKRLVAESILKESYSDLDISKAIKSGNYELKGRTPHSDLSFWMRDRYKEGEPWIGSARMFNIHLYQQDGDRWLNLYISFLTGCNLSYFYSDRKIIDNWDFKTTNYIRKPYKGIELVEITPEFLEEIKSNNDLRKVIEKHIEFNVQGQQEDVAQGVYDRYKKLLNSADAKLNNEGVEAIKRYIARQDAERQIREYANAQQEKLGRKYRYYKEYYRGEGSIAHDDDYEGSGETSLGGIAVDLGCKTKEDVDKLIDNLHDGSISQTSGNYRYIYSEKK